MSIFRQKVLSGLSWSVLGRGFNQVVTVGIGILLARLLSPEVFGLLGMVVIFTGFANLFNGLGLGAAIIQSDDITEAHLSSIFWLNVGCGIGLFAFFVVAAPWIADFYGEPMLVSLTSVLAFQFVIGSINSVHETLFRKAVDFRPIALISIGTTVVSGAVGVGMALSGYGVWSLVGKSLTGSVTGTVAYWIVSPWRPSLRFDWGATKELLGFSLNLVGEQVLNYWVRRVDDLLIGKIIGPAALGLYTKAYGLMLMPLNQVSRVISQVLFPSLSTIKNDPSRVKRLYLRAAQTVALITFPMMLGLLATSETVVLAVLGKQWERMVPILRTFCVLGLAQSVGALIGNLFKSQGRADLMLRLGVFVKLWMIGAIIIGIQWGVMGVTVCYTFASLVALYPETRYGGKLVGLSFKELISSLAGIFSCAAFMGICVYTLGITLPSDWPHWLQLLTQVSSGIAIYWGLVHGFGLQAYRETTDLLLEQWQQRTASGTAS